MPVMHRLACLRDDAIFLVYLYQRWKYRTDYSRVNEFGQCAEPTEEMIEQIQNDESEDSKVDNVLEGEKIDVVTDNVSIDAAATGGIRRRGGREKRSQ
jgi:hypothetical protein